MSQIEISGCRYYDLTIETGKLYEVWLTHDGEPEACVAIRDITPTKESSRPFDIWEVLVGSQLKRIASNNIFEVGKSTRPPETLAHKTPMPTIFTMDFTYDKKEDKP